MVLSYAPTNSAPVPARPPARLPRLPRQAFTTLKNIVRGKRIQSAAEKLEQNLFQLNSTLRTASLRLRRLCFEASGWCLFTLDRTKTYTLKEFVAAQGKERDRISEWLLAFSDDVRVLVRGACDEVSRAGVVGRGVEFMRRGSQCSPPPPLPPPPFARRCWTASWLRSPSWPTTA